MACPLHMAATVCGANTQNLMYNNMGYSYSFTSVVIIDMWMYHTVLC